MATKGMIEFRANGEDFTINDPNIAEEFDSTKAYHIHDHVYYQGDLYVFVAEHAAGTWNTSHVLLIKVGAELANLWSANETEATLRAAADSDLKSALTNTINALDLIEKTFDIVQGNISSTDGYPTESPIRVRTTFIKVSNSKFVYIKIPDNYKAYVYYYNAQQGFVPDGIGWFYSDCVLSTEKGTYIRVVGAKSDNSTIVPSDFEAAKVFVFNTETLSSGDNLNNIIVPGAYKCSANSGLPVNTPQGVGGLLIVDNSNGFISQTFYNNNLTAFRFSSDNGATWPEWSLTNRNTVLFRSVLVQTDDLNNITQTGIYQFTSGLIPNHSPVSTVGAIVLVYNYTYTQQVLYCKSGNQNIIYHRMLVSGSWSEWAKLGNPNTLSFVKVLTNADNLNDITQTGIYRYSINSLPTNVPINTAGGLLIVYNETITQQIFYCKIPDGTNAFYYRIFANSAWSDWASVSNNSIASWGLSNALANANNIKSIKWTPVGDMPMNDGTYFPIAEHTGIPYSSVRDQDKAVGIDVSFRTFMTAVRDPNSVLYTRRSTVTNSSTYYGTVCSGLINVAYGINLDLSNYFLGTWDAFEDIPMMEIEKGDMIYIYGHVAFIKNVIRDMYGRIKKVTVTEEWSPLPQNITYYSWDEFITAREGYIARRYKYLNGVEYNDIPWVQNFDETAVTVTYPDIQTEFGDEAVFMKGEDVKINVINASDYTDIVVTDEDGVIVYTSTNISGFTLENVDAGLYTITAHGSTDSVSTFYVVDATASFDDTTGDVTFSSTNADPAVVFVYNLPANRNVVCKPIILTKAQKIAGTVNVLSLMDSEYKYAKVTFMTPYGSAVWYSETHEKWVPIE